MNINIFSDKKKREIDRAKVSEAVKRNIGRQNFSAYHLLIDYGISPKLSNEIISNLRLYPMDTKNRENILKRNNTSTAEVEQEKLRIKHKYGCDVNYTSALMSELNVSDEQIKGLKELRNRCSSNSGDYEIEALNYITNELNIQNDKAQKYINDFIKMRENAKEQNKGYKSPIENLLYLSSFINVKGEINGKESLTVLEKTYISATLMDYGDKSETGNRLVFYELLGEHDRLTQHEKNLFEGLKFVGWGRESLARSYVNLKEGNASDKDISAIIGVISTYNQIYGKKN